VLCFVFFLSSFTSETTRRGTIRAREEILKERVKERERILCSIFFDRKETHWRREKRKAALLWSRTGKRGEN